jgi:hypothetical protein
MRLDSFLINVNRKVDHIFSPSLIILKKNVKNSSPNSRRQISSKRNIKALLFFNSFSRWLIVENFVPPDVFDTLRERCLFDEDEEKWLILKPGEQRPKSGEDANKLDAPAMLDSGLGGASSSDVSSSGESSVKRHLLFAKRPVSFFQAFP